LAKILIRLKGSFSAAVLKKFYTIAGGPCSDKAPYLSFNDFYLRLELSAIFSAMLLSSI